MLNKRKKEKIPSRSTEKESITIESTDVKMIINFKILNHHYLKICILTLKTFDDEEIKPNLQKM